MRSATAPREFTGRHMLASILAFFGVIIAVNLTMAYFANSTWSGLVVANGYMASQSFDDDLAKARAQDAMGWTVERQPRDEPRQGVLRRPQQGAAHGMTVTGMLRRPATDREDQALSLRQRRDRASTRAEAALANGVWDVEITPPAQAARPIARPIASS